MRIQRLIFRFLFAAFVVGFIVINLSLIFHIDIIPYRISKQYSPDTLPDVAIKVDSGHHDAPPVVTRLENTTIANFVTVASTVNVKRTMTTADYFAFVQQANEVAFSAIPWLTAASVIVIIQVHRRTEYLSQLILSLSKAKDIENTLLIFSHDFVSDDINLLISGIKFCKVLQIFFPYSLQLHPNLFPGTDPNDCPRDATKEIARQMKCINAETPDKYGHYREAPFCQTKHHWFWKINQVFDHLPATKAFLGPVLLLEEDHYVVEDFVHVLNMMFKIAPVSCPECSIFTLGNYEKNPSLSASSNKVGTSDWMSTRHNMGMAFNRTVWQRIKSCAMAFCSFDDYNWDWTLQYLSLTCIPGKLKVMATKFARVFHIGECGTHHKSENCQPTDIVGQINALLTNEHKFLFPETLVFEGADPTGSQVPKPNGGWGDTRDHELCTSFLA